MKIGDLVRSIQIDSHDVQVGVVVETINNPLTLPPVVKVLWQNGAIDKEWTDELEVINESR